MRNKKSFRVGDKIVDFGQVNRIFKIKEKIIFFRPYFKTKQNKTSTCSIPLKNIVKTNIRKPISKKELEQLLKSLSKKSDLKTPINITRVKGILNLNDPHETARILKSLWMEKNDESTNFTKTRESVFKIAANRLVEEVALVNGVTLGKAEKQIKAALLKILV